MHIRKQLTKETLFQYISDYDIFKYYCPGFTAIGDKFNSSFRKEKEASAVIYVNASGRLMYNDFIEPVKTSIGFVMALYNITYGKALHKVAADFRIDDLLYYDSFDSIDNNKNKKAYITKYTPKASKGTSIIQVKRREWLTKDIEYWAQGNITPEIAKLFNVSPISYYWINGNRFTAASLHYDYPYYWLDNILLRKLYAPQGNKYTKWISNSGYGVFQGEHLLPRKGNLLIITKSLKDVMSLYSLGYTAIAPPNEHSITVKEYFNKQIQRFDRVVILYDNDEGGRSGAKKLQDLFNLEAIEYPIEKRAKDTFEYISLYGVDTTKQQLTKLLNL